MEESDRVLNGLKAELVKVCFSMCPNLILKKFIVQTNANWSDSDIVHVRFILYFFNRVG